MLYQENFFIKKYKIKHLYAVLFFFFTYPSSILAASHFQIVLQCRQVLKELVSQNKENVSPRKIKEQYKETRLNLEVTDLSDYGIGKKEKINLIQDDKKRGLTFLTTIEERLDYKLFIFNGLLYDSKGSLVDSSHRIFEIYSYVMDAKGNVYFGNLHHPGYLNFNDIAAAGNIKVKKGRLLMADRESGQYEPKKKLLQQFKDRLIEMRADLSQADFKFHGFWDD